MSMTAMMPVMFTFNVSNLHDDYDAYYDLMGTGDRIVHDGLDDCDVHDVHDGFYSGGRQQIFLLYHPRQMTTMHQMITSITG
jgi:hypothetical protein